MKGGRCLNNFDMIAKFGADVSGFARGVNKMKSDLKGLQAQSKLSAKAIGNALAGAGKALTVGLSVPLVALSGVALKTSVDLETAMTGVAKTTDMAGDELEAFKKDLQAMSGEIPVATTELANIAESAGQLGIEKENLLSFTRTMADLGVATNLSSEEAATSLARLANITQMPQDEFDKLGSVVVDLGNNLATTEQEIVEMSLRLAGTGKQVGLTEAEIMGLSGAMSSVGISAQAGGSAMSKAMQMINSDVLAGSENVQGFADVAGMSAEEFSEAWQNDPIAALDAFIGGLGDISDSGGDVAGTLKDLGIKNLNMVDTLSRLTGASGLMTESVDRANRAWDENSALTEEAETAYDTVANKLVTLGNKVKTLAQRFGDLLLPIFGDVIDKVIEWVDALSEMDDSTLKTIAKVAGFVGALGPVLFILGKIVGFIPVVVGAFKAFQTGMALSGTMALQTGSMMSILGSAFTFLMSPIGLVIGALAGLIAVGVLVWKNWDKIVEKAHEDWNTIKEFFTVIIPEIFNTIMDWFKQLPVRIKEKWDEIIESARAWGSRMKEKAIETGSSFLESITTFFSELPYKIGYFIGNSLAKVVLWALDMKDKAVETGKDFLDSIVSFFKNLPTKIANFLTDSYNKVITWGSNMKDKASEAGSQFISSVISYIKNLPSRIQTWLTSSISRLTTWVGNMGSKGREAGSDLLDKTVDGVKNLPSKMASAGADVVKGFWRGITNLSGWIKGKVKGFFNGIVDGVKGALKISSPSKVFEEFGEFVDEGFIQGIDKGARNVKRSMGSMVDGAVKVAKRTNVIPVNFSAKMVGNVQSALNNGLNVNTPRVSDQRIVHELSNNEQNKPMYLNLVMGGKTFRAYVENISEQQGQDIDLEMEF